MLIKTFLLAILATVAWSQCLSENDVSSDLNQNAMMKFTTSQQTFSVALLDAINKVSPDENVFFSPYSTYHALLLAYFGATQQTEEGLKKILNLEWADSKFIVLQAYKIESLRRALRRQSSVKFFSAHKLYFSSQIKVRNCMLELFANELGELDFQDSGAARMTINNWVKNATQNNIKNFLSSPTSVTTLTKMVMINAAFIKGSWASEFDRRNTRNSIFYPTVRKQIFVPMMQQKGIFNYTVSEDLGALVLQIPFEGEDLSFIVFLPPFVPNGLSDVISKLTPETLKQTLDNAKPREVELSIPKFRMSHEYELKPILESMNVGDLFHSTSDFEKFSLTDDIHPESAVHEAIIEADESGWKAQENVDTSEAKTQFNCNHPFLFLIYDHLSRVILFSGIFRGLDRPANPLLLSDVRDDPVETDKCGTLHPLGTLTGLVAGGETIARGTWPWLVAVFGYTGPSLSFRCGASLISERLVLSAAHCFFYRNGNRLRVTDTVIILGKYSLRRLDEEGAKIVYPDNLIIHPDYKFHKPDADIAVLVTPESLQFSKFIRPICLWNASESEDITKRQGIAAGWGMDEEGNVFSDLPRRVSVPVVSNFICRNAGLQYQVLVTERTMCVGWRNGTSGVCQGDSGGGLAFEINGQWVLRGLVSTSPVVNQGGSCNLNEYTIFSDVSKFLDWIKSKNPS